MELKLWGWSSSDAENAALTDLVTQFNTATGASAEFQPQAEYDTTLNTALAGGDPPDVFYVDSFKLPDLAEAGALAPVPSDAIATPRISTRRCRRPSPTTEPGTALPRTSRRWHWSTTQPRSKRPG